MLTNMAIINPCLSLKMDYMNRQFNFLHENKYTFQSLIKKYKGDFFLNESNIHNAFYQPIYQFSLLFGLISEELLLHGHYLHENLIFT